MNGGCFYSFEILKQKLASHIYAREIILYCSWLYKFDVQNKSCLPIFFAREIILNCSCFYCFEILTLFVREIIASFHPILMQKRDIYSLKSNTRVPIFMQGR